MGRGRKRLAAQLPVVNLANGDKLVTFSSNSSTYSLLPIRDKGACLPVVWQSGVVAEVLTEVYPSNAEFNIKPSSSGNFVTEIQGQSITPYTGSWGPLSGQSKSQHEEKVRNANDEFCNALNSEGIPFYTASSTWNNGGGIEEIITDYVVCGDYGDVITLGQYQGTRYVSADFILSSTLYEISVNNVTDTAVEKTHDGYFVVDIPDSVSGTYAVSDESGVCYAFSVIR